MASLKLIRALSIIALFLLCDIVGTTGCGGGSSNPGPLPFEGSNASSTASGSSSAGSSSGSQALTCSATTYSPNFVDETDSVTGLPNRLFHWSRFPVRVYFVNSDLSTPDLQAQALQGFNWWVKNIHGVSFTQVTDQSQADISVQFQNRGQTNYGAITNYHTNANGQLTDATITFNMTYLSSVSTIAPVAAHEFGHALGIAGHSNHNGDVMQSSPGVYYLTQLSTRDTNTMLTAYCGITPLSTKAAAPSFISLPTGEVRCSLGVLTR